MFHYDDGLFLTRAGLAVDVRRRQPRGFVSHAHADHMARHEWAFATPETAALYRHRLGDRLRVREMAYETPLELGGVQLTTHPAGHCLGSAMLLADDGQQRLLYTGDFKLGPSLTACEAQLPSADLLIMETTFGSPRYRLPPREQVVEQLFDTILSALAQDRTPVIHAYALGKAQEVTALLTQEGFRVLQHPTIAEVSDIYTSCGVSLGDYSVYGPRAEPGFVAVTLPKSMRGYRLAGLQRTLSIAVTGWAVYATAPDRWQVDVALPLSDHADFDQLFEAVRQVGPNKIFTTHGPHGFDQHLRDAGFDAEPLSTARQPRLFY